MIRLNTNMKYFSNVSEGRCMDSLPNFSVVKVEYDNSYREVVLNTFNITQGLSVDGNFIYWLKDDHLTVWNRICDHAGGRLIAKKGVVICPLHGWTFNPETHSYQNVKVSKAPLYEGRLDFNDVSVTLKSEKLKTMPFDTDSEVKLRYLNHACVVLETDQFSIALDPWLFGPAFSNGWWLQTPSKTDALDLLNSVDAIFISHNHPDHLNLHTLESVSKDIVIITPNFQGSNCADVLKDLGFHNIVIANFGEAFLNSDEEIFIAPLKSGDFRNDSGVLLQVGTFKAIFNVDSNYLDFWRFPNDVTLFASSYASGTSGYPICFDNYTDEKKRDIVKRNKGSKRATIKSILMRMVPNYFLPYAGAFTEKAPRDKYIVDLNSKNSISDYKDMCDSLSISLLDYRNTDNFMFRGSKLILSDNVEVPRRNIDDIESYIFDTQEDYGRISLTHLRDYFQNCSFRDDLTLEVLYANDAFESNFGGFHLDFSKKELDIRAGPFDGNLAEDHRFLRLKVREHEFSKVVQDFLPWENLFIGFQLKAYRNPDVYNAEFWYHFSNIHVGGELKRSSADCNACEKILQKLDYEAIKEEKHTK